MTSVRAKGIKIERDMRTAQIQEIKDDLIARGVDISGPCGAFAITNRVAIRLSMGVFYKPGGNNCRERSTDLVIGRDGGTYDILADSGGENKPQWYFIGQSDPDRYRDPYPIEGVPPPPPSGQLRDPELFYSDVRIAIGRVEQSLSRIETTLYMAVEEVRRALAAGKKPKK